MIISKILKFGVRKERERDLIKSGGVSLVAQWFDPWSEKIPYAIGQLNRSATSTKPVL